MDLGKNKIKWVFVFLLFTLAFSLRVWNLNKMGRTWDEPYYVESAYTFIDLARKGDFTNPSWYRNESSGFPPLSRYLYGIAGALDVHGLDSMGKPLFNYDYTHSRLVSVLFSSLTVVLVVLMGWKYISPFVGITSGTILSMLPFFLGFSQIATLESLIIFFFTATIFSFINLLVSFSKKNIFLTGILLGLSMAVKYTNFLLIPLIICIYIIWYFKGKKYRKFNLNNIKPIVAIIVIGFTTFFVLWPMPWFHLQDVFLFNKNLRYSPYSVPEVFFGKLILVPKIYYFLYFLITTPLLILILFLIGLKRLDHKRNWFFLSIAVWFIFPFVQSLYNYKQHGLRYIIEVYAPLSIIAAVGLEYTSSKIHKVKHIKAILLFALIIYLFLILFRITPYYLDYFNELVGGPKNVYEKRMFQLGWWGQGIREAAYYVEKNSTPGSTIGIAISPSHVMPPLPKLNVKTYNTKENYDYVIVNYYNILREGFDDRLIKKNYKRIYSVMADGASIVDIYKTR